MSGAVATSNESYCTFTLASDVTAGGLPSQEEISKDLESKDPKVKRHALKAAIMAMLGGEPMPRILMQVIRFCINTDDKPLKKLCMLYWEVVPKYQELTSDEIIRAAGGAATPRKLLPEMILVCNALRNDLTHPNEYVRGSMLRFLCKLKDQEILTPLIPSVKQCLEHKHPYVRKNAALAVFHAHKLFGETLIPDGPELIEGFLLKETDVAARRNAFLMLVNQNEELAVDYLSKHIEDAATKFGDGFAFLVLELTRKVCRRDPSQKSRFVRVLFFMLSSNSAAVSYESAWTLVSLSNAPSAIRAAASTYAGLLNSQNDNNVKMIVLERLEEMKKKHCKILQEVLMDIMRALSSPNPDVCKKVLDITMDIVTSRNIGEVVSTLKRDLAKTKHDNDVDTKGPAYRTMLIKAIHSCALRFPDVAESTVPTLMDFLPLDGGLSVISFLKATVDKYPDLREKILMQLMNVMPDIPSNSIMNVCLWIIGEYCLTPDLIDQAFECVTEQVGLPPFVQAQVKEPSADESKEERKLVTKNVVLADGTYATQTTYSEPASKTTEASVPHLRKMIVAGDVFLGINLASCLTKLALRVTANSKSMTVKTILISCGLVKMAELSVSPQKSSFSDCKDRLSLFCRVLLEPKVNNQLKESFLTQGKLSFEKFLEAIEEQEKSQAQKAAQDAALPTAQPDDLIHFRQLNATAVQAGDIDLDDGSDLTRATGYNSAGSLLSSELSHVYQLSGFADPVYAEALVTVRDYDISLEILLINRTPNGLTNLTVELSTMGDMKIVERPQSLNIGPLDQTTIRASIKVSSTETGHIFGTIVYDDTYTGAKVYINLNDIHMDIMDYIHPAKCSDEVFRSMWAEFEWENKVAISTTITDLQKFLNHVVKETNMSCLTKIEEGGNKGNFLAANLYARSVFGEDALVNVSVEKKEDNDGKLAGYIRIRSKTQGIALSLGDRITTVQRGANVNSSS